MKVLQIIDSPWAIGALARKIEEYNPHHSMRMLTIHPKEYRADMGVYNGALLNEIKRTAPQVVHFHYWDTAWHLAEMLKAQLGEACPKLILTHHNQKNLLSREWDKFDAIAVHTKKAKGILETAGYQNVHIIQHGIELEHFRYREEKPDTENRLLGYVGRIVPWKNLKGILQAARSLDTEVVMMGKIDRADYWRECQEYSEQMDERFATPFDEQPSVYHEMAVYIGNSDDDIEEGPLGLLEAMACGTPVITTPAGEAADIIRNRENGILVPFNDQDALENALKDFFAMSLQERDRMRSKAWDTVKVMTAEKMAYMYEKLYYKVAFEKDLCSVIIPTYNRAETLKGALKGFAEQDYQPIEIIVCDDNSSDNTEAVVSEFRSEHPAIAIRYINTHLDGYGLARARNEGILKASGYYLVFSDDRWLPRPTAVRCLVKRLASIKGKSAVWGKKDEYSGRSFIENFFAIRKRHMVLAGMFNERGTGYGFQSQEIRERLLWQEFSLQYAPEAQADPLVNTRRGGQRRYDIARSKLLLWKLNN